MIALESPIARPSVTSTGVVSPPQSRLARRTWVPGATERRRCGMRLWSSAQRAFSLKCEKRICQRTGVPAAGVTGPPAATTSAAGPPSCSSSSTPVGHVRVDLGERDRGAVAGDHGDDLGALGEALDRRGQGRAGAAPGDDLARSTKPTASPCRKRPCGVVARGRRDAAGRDPGQRPLEPARRSPPRQPQGRARPAPAGRPAGRCTGRRGPASRRARRRARPPSPRSRSWAGPAPRSAGDLVDPRQQIS